MRISAEVSVSGLFKSIEVLDKAGNVKRTYGGFSNIITDIGLQRLAATSDIGPVHNYCRVGTGNSTPVASNTQLDAQIAASAIQGDALVNNNLADGYHNIIFTYTFAVGAVVGNISELATAWGPTGQNNIFSRALIRDGNGNPTSITILADEILRVTWELRRYWPTGDFSGTIENIGNKGGSYSWLCRAARVSDWSYSNSNNQTYGVQVFTAPQSGSPLSSLAGCRVYPSPSSISNIEGIPTGNLDTQFTVTPKTKTLITIKILKKSSSTRSKLEHPPLYKPKRKKNFGGGLMNQLNGGR